MDNRIPAVPQRNGLLLRRLTALVCMVAASTVFTAASKIEPAQPKTQEEASASNASSGVHEINLLIEKYAKSIDEADPILASEVWWNSPEVSFIHPLGHEHGFEQIKQNVYKHLMGDMFSERKLSPHDVSVHVYGDAAWAEFYWDFAAKVRKDGSPITTHGRETQVYWKLGGRWRLVHVHYSALPVMAERSGM